MQIRNNKQHLYSARDSRCEGFEVRGIRGARDSRCEGFEVRGIRVASPCYNYSPITGHAFMPSVGTVDLLAEVALIIVLFNWMSCL